MSSRIERANSVLQKNIAEILEKSLNDPRLSGCLISVSKVAVSSDLKYAKVFLSILPVDKREFVLSLVSGAKGFIKKELSTKIKFRALPELNFLLDTSEDYSEKINSMLNDITYADENSYNDENYKEDK